MTMQLELWHLITLLLAFFSACAGGAKLLLHQIERHLDQRLDGIEAAAKDEAGEWRRIEREMMAMKADMPLHYVRREDYIRGQSVIEAKLDALALKLENVQLRQVGAGD